MPTAAPTGGPGGDLPSTGMGTAGLYALLAALLAAIGGGAVLLRRRSRRD